MPAFPATAAGPRGLLSGGDFRRLLGVRLSGQFSDGVFQASLAGAVLFNPERAATPADIAAGFAVLLLPYSLLGPFAGVLLDRWSRQRVLVLANLARAVLVGGVAALIWTGIGGTALYAAALVVVSVSRFVLSTLSAALPRVTPADQLVPANALTTTAGTVAAVLGGACGVGVGALAGSGDARYGGIAVSATVGYLLAALLAAGFGRPRLGPDEAEVQNRPSAGHILAGLRAGVRHIRRDPAVRAALLVIGTHRFVFGLATVATVLLYRYYFDGSTLFPAGLAGLTQVLVAASAGALTAAVVTPRAVRAWGTRRWIVALLAGAALSQLAFGLPFRPAATVVGAALLGFAGQGVKICVDAILQRRVGDGFRGRVFSVYDTLFNVAFVVAAVVAALTLPITGKSYPMLVVVAVGYSLAAAAYARTPDDLGTPPVRTGTTP
ncbi:MAG: MFS transporter [Geodermatophilaceae bacterium]|nr:MFS transporter [Geodermatophilaceae bacterium]